MSAGRWDFLEGAKTFSAAEAIVREVATRLAADLRKFPPELDWTDELWRAKFAPLYEAARLAGGHVAVAEAAVKDGFVLARWELEHDFAAIDFHQRNDHAARVAPTAIDRLGLELVWRYLTESLLALAEATEGRLKRRHLVDCLALTERLLLGA